MTAAANSNGNQRARGPDHRTVTNTTVAATSAASAQPVTTRVGVAPAAAPMEGAPFVAVGNGARPAADRRLAGEVRDREHAMNAYADQDLALATSISDMDSYLDDLQKQFIQAIFESHAAGRIDLQVAIQLAVVARFYERIGDHAVNMGEKVRFQVTGWLPEHSGAARHRERSLQDPTPAGELRKPMGGSPPDA